MKIYQCLCFWPSHVCFMACESETENEPQLPLVAEMVEDLSAPNDVIDRTTGQVLEEMPFQYFSLSENRVMTVDESWDLAFKGTTIRTNASKNVSAALVDGIFRKLKKFLKQLHLHWIPKQRWQYLQEVVMAGTAIIQQLMP